MEDVPAAIALAWSLIGAVLAVFHDRRIEEVTPSLIPSTPPETVP